MSTYSEAKIVMQIQLLPANYSVATLHQRNPTAATAVIVSGIFLTSFFAVLHLNLAACYL